MPASSTTRSAIWSRRSRRPARRRSALDARNRIDILRDLRAGELTLPEDLVRRFAEARSLSQGPGKRRARRTIFHPRARPRGDPLRLARETAAASAPEKDLYDALMDEHRPGMTARGSIRCCAISAPASRRWWCGGGGRRGCGGGRRSVCGAEAQRAIVRDLLEQIGFDFARGALDTATHPGTSALGFDDVRLSLRPGEQGLRQSILTALHEAGHGLYDQGYDPPTRARCSPPRLRWGLHGANARLWENHVGRSRAFLELHGSAPRRRAARRAGGRGSGAASTASVRASFGPAPTS